MPASAHGLRATLTALSRLSRCSAENASERASNGHTDGRSGHDPGMPASRRQRRLAPAGCTRAVRLKRSEHGHSTTRRPARLRRQGRAERTGVPWVWTGVGSGRADARQRRRCVGGDLVESWPSVLFRVPDTISTASARPHRNSSIISTVCSAEFVAEEEEEIVVVSVIAEVTE